jgi:hypothetical protein
VYFIGTPFFSGVPFAAALATIEEIKASGAIENRPYGQAPHEALLMPY